MTSSGGRFFAAANVRSRSALKVKKGTLEYQRNSPVGENLMVNMLLKSHVAFPATILFLGAFAGMSGCGKGNNVSESLSTTVSNTLNGSKLTAQRVKVDAASTFADVLGPGPTTMPDGKTVKFDAYLLGQLSLPSGRIVAADGFIMFGVKPFTRSVKAGSYPVTIAVALLDDDQRIAFAQIRFSGHRVARWEMAVTSGQDPSKLKPDEMYAYGVDSGTGSFADPGAQEVLSADDANKLVDAAMEQMKNVNEPTRDWVLIDTPKGSAALFSSGWGDGGYASYFGLDDAGEPAALITDFQVIDWERRPSM